MKMKTVIEVGRKSSPLVNGCIEGLKEHTQALAQLLVDFSSVKSEQGRAAMIEQCAMALDRLGDSLKSMESEWRRFDSALGDYKYQFGKRKKKGESKDCPGQQMMVFEV